MDWPADWDDIVEVRLHVLKRNTAAVALFKKWGFEVVQTTFSYYAGHSVLRMVKKADIGGVKVAAKKAQATVAVKAAPDKPSGLDDGSSSAYTEEEDDGYSDDSLDEDW